MGNQIVKKLLGKLRNPIHITYIAKYILETDEKTCRKELKKMEKNGLIVENVKFKDYFSVK